MDRSAELRDFLRSRRARLQPPDVGLPWPAGQRRTSGLRRAEIASVAGVSVDYYTRLEQGRARNVSAQVLNALAQALKLDALERDYLYALAHPAGTPTVDAPQAKASAGVRAMVDALDPMPALLHGPFLEVLAVNRMGVRLFADFMAMPVGERNLARWTFLDPRARVVYPQWDVVASQMVAILRRAAGTRSDNPQLVALVAELSAASPDFARSWADHRVFRHTHGRKTIHHELVGDLHLHYQSLIVPQDPDQYVVLYIAPPGSAAAASLAELATRSEPTTRPRWERPSPDRAWTAARSSSPAS